MYYYSRDGHTPLRHSAPEGGPGIVLDERDNARASGSLDITEEDHARARSELAGLRVIEEDLMTLEQAIYFFTALRSNLELRLIGHAASMRAGVLPPPSAASGGEGEKRRQPTATVHALSRPPLGTRHNSRRPRRGA